ncbi:Gfo/Idh/MocA family oxidoreductase [Streptomyces sp. NPDC051183]|uniref:Gfo/Idh/MocA family protein n=1 Tax=Streptomyces sp. NPDC051183 TaxID=3155165 RepID=UPI00341EE082
MPSGITLAVVGAGDRGTGHARWALAHPDRATVVAVAEPRKVRRDRLATAHGLDAGSVVDDWRELAARGRIADAVLICTLDREHLEPVLAFAALGYHIMLEKPMALTEEECRRIVAAVEEAGVILSVGHVLRYTPYTQALKRVLDSGRIGDVVSVQHLEPVGFWHQAHSFVRGNWRREDEATSMLMAKSCHDLDWLQYVLGRPPVRVSSFGRLSHFRPENRPAGAADRCLDCTVETACPYSAKRDYGDRLAEGRHGWPLSVLVDEFTPRALETALREGPYGRCVYACDNDVVDHQVVAMEFDSGATATFTMTAFTEQADRQTRIFGTRGELRGDGMELRVYDFLTRTEEVLGIGAEGAMDAAGGHGGGDAGLMDAFVGAVATGDPGLVKSGPHESLISHLTVLAAERARRDNTVVII